MNTDDEEQLQKVRDAVDIERNLRAIVRETEARAVAEVKAARKAWCEAHTNLVNLLSELPYVPQRLDS